MYNRTYNKQWLTADDLNFGVNAHADQLQNTIFALTGGWKSYPGSGSIAGTSVSAPNALKVDRYSVFGNAVYQHIAVSAGNAIDADGAYITVPTTEIVSVSVLAKGAFQGVYNVYIRYAETDAEPATDDKLSAYDTQISDSYEIDITPDTYSYPWIKLATIRVDHGFVTTLTDLHDTQRLQVVATDRSTFIPSGSVGYPWQQTVYDHIHALGSGSITALNPHGLNGPESWEEVTDKPLYLVANAAHGNGFAIYDPIDGTTQAYPSHEQSINESSPASGCVFVSRWGSACQFNTQYPTDAPIGPVFYSGLPRQTPAIYTRSLPLRQGGGMVWADGILDREGNGPAIWLIDSSQDWRYRWVIAQGFLEWGLQNKYPEGVDVADAFAAFRYDSGAIRYDDDVTYDNALVRSIGYLHAGLPSAVYPDRDVAELRRGIHLRTRFSGYSGVVSLFADNTNGHLYAHVRSRQLTIKKPGSDQVIRCGLSYGLKLLFSPQYSGTAGASPYTSTINTTDGYTLSEFINILGWIAKAVPSFLPVDKYHSFVTMAYDKNTVLYVPRFTFGASQYGRGLVKVPLTDTMVLTEADCLFILGTLTGKAQVFCSTVFANAVVATKLSNAIYSTINYDFTPEASVTEAEQELRRNRTK